MSMVRRWIVRCDSPECMTVLVHEPIPDGDKWDYGMATNDAGWSSAPNRDTTYCPVHFAQGDLDNEALRPEREADQRAAIERSARDLSQAVAGRGRRQS